MFEAPIYRPRFFQNIANGSHRGNTIVFSPTPYEGTQLQYTFHISQLSVTKPSVFCNLGPGGQATRHLGPLTAKIWPTLKTKQV